MGDFNTDYIMPISAAINGSEVREKIVNALNYLNVNGVNNAQTLGGHDASYYTPIETFNDIIDYDKYPVEGSTKAVTSGGLYDIFNIMDMYLINIIGNTSVNNSEELNG